MLTNKTDVLVLLIDCQYMINNPIIVDIWHVETFEWQVRGASLYLRAPTDDFLEVGIKSLLFFLSRF